MGNYCSREIWNHPTFIPHRSKIFEFLLNHYLHAHNKTVELGAFIRKKKFSTLKKDLLDPCGGMYIHPVLKSLDWEGHKDKLTDF